MVLYNHKFFSHERVELYTSLGLTVEGTGGGLLLGQPHSNDGIPVLVKYAEGYRYEAEFEGQEYFLNPAATKIHFDKLHQINQSATDKLLGLEQPSDLSGITVLDCNSPDSTYKSKFLLMDARSTQYVINKHSTWRHLQTLEELNAPVKWKFTVPPLTLKEDDVQESSIVPLTTEYVLPDFLAGKPEKQGFLKRLVKLFKI